MSFEKLIKSSISSILGQFLLILGLADKPSIVCCDPMFVIFSYAIETVGAPVFMSAATNFLAGFALVWSETQAFFEIGVFLLTMTVISFIAAIIIFPEEQFYKYR